MTNPAIDGDMERALEWVAISAWQGNADAAKHLPALQEAVAAYDPDRMTRCGNTTAQPKGEDVGRVMDAVREAADELEGSGDRTLKKHLPVIVAALTARAGGASPTTGQEADARDAAMFAWLAKHPNLYTVTDLLRADQYVTLRRACEALMSIDAASEASK